MSEITRKLEEKEKQYWDQRIFLDTNKVWMSGIIGKKFEFSHEIYGEKFYRSEIKVFRYSGTPDFIPIMVSDRVPYFERIAIGEQLSVGGQIRTYNVHHDDGRRSLDIFLFVTIIEFEKFNYNDNLLYLNGYLCKKPIYRKTSLGRRDITELLIAVNRTTFRKSDYIPCIVWGKNAIWASNLQIGDHIQITGRLQSREYFKRFSPNSEEGERKTAYEVSIKTIETL